MTKEHLLEYLYGEMNEKQKKLFEETLQEDATMQQELAELRMVRSFLEHSNDEQVSPAQVVVKPRIVRKLSRWWAIAAAGLVMMVAGKLLNVTADWRQNQFTLSFGNPTETLAKDENISSEQYAKLETGIESLKAQLTSFREEQQNLALPAAQVDEQPVVRQSDRQLMQLILATFNEQQSKIETRLSNQILEEQQIYIQSVAQELIRYWDEQRKDDLEIINEGLQNLAQSIQFSNDDLVQLVNNPRKNY